MVKVEIAHTHTYKHTQIHTKTHARPHTHGHTHMRQTYVGKVGVHATMWCYNKPANAAGCAKIINLP